MGTAFALASFVIGNLHNWIGAGVDVYELYQKTQAVIDDNKGPGADEWNALDEKARALQSIVRDTSRDA
jgi:hypothetical protein